MIKIKECKKIMKVCTSCGKLKSIQKFYKRRAKNGTIIRDGQCKQCIEEKRRKRYTLVCEYCGKEFTCGVKKQKFCSPACQGKSRDNKVKYNCEICGKECKESKQHYLKSKHHFCGSKCMYIWQSQNWKGENHHNWNPNLTQEERNRCRISSKDYDEWRMSVYKRDNFTCQYCKQSKGKYLNAHHLNGFNWDKNNRYNIDNGVTLCEECHKKFHKLYGKGNNTKEQFKEWISKRKN